jgi:hypothetical protein
LIIEDFRRKTDFQSELGVKMVDIFIGPSRHHFRVHTELLSSKVEYFKKMFKGTFKEGVEQKADLPDEYSDAFGLFVHWLYRDFLQPIDISKHNPPKYDVFLDRVRLYCFAEKICLPTLMDYTMTTLMSGYSEHSEHPLLEAAIAAYESSSPNSHIRTYMSKHFAWYIAQYSDSDSLAANRTSPCLAQTLIASQDLTADVLRYLRGTNGRGTKGYRAVPDPRGSDKCQFHAHSSGEICLFKDKTLKSLNF